MLPIAAILLAFLGARDVSSLRMAEAGSKQKEEITPSTVFGRRREF